MLNLSGYRKESIKKELFQLELQGIIKNTALHELDNALQSIRKIRPIKVNYNQYIIGGQ